MFKNIAALLGSAAATALAAFMGALQSADATGVVGTDPIKVLGFSIGVALVLRGVNWLIARLG